jgi:hypothetical protein
MTPEQRVDVLKLVVSEEGSNMRFETTTAQRLMTGFATVELGLGAWIVSNGPTKVSACWALFFLNWIFGAAVAMLIVLNYRRRDEVVGSLRTALRALRLADPGAYLPSEPIYVWKKSTSWRWPYLALTAFFCLAQIWPLFFRD